MARAAAKRRPRPKPHAHGERRHAGGAAVEQTLFFQRIRRQAKWVFVFLAFVFAITFVAFGVGSGNVGLQQVGDWFGGGGPGGPSISKARERVAKNPRDAQAYRDLARAYQLRGQDLGAIGALESYVRLRPKDREALFDLAAVYQQRAQLQTQDAQLAAFEAQAAAPSTFGPAPTTQLGRAFAGSPDPVQQALTQTANQRYNGALQRLTATYGALASTYRNIVRLDPTDSTALLTYAQFAQLAGDTTAALDAYQDFVKKFPDDPSVASARQQIRTLRSQVSAVSGG